MSASLRIPAEWEPHSCCWMSWAVQEYGGRDKIEKIKHELDTIIRTIAQDEFVNLLAPSGELFREAQARFSTCDNVSVRQAPVDDIWMRDIAPTFAVKSNVEGSEVVGIDWNFNGWGNTRYRAARPGDRLCGVGREMFGVPFINASFVAEGGAFVTDGAGTTFTTSSCLLSADRNPTSDPRSLRDFIENDLVTRLGSRRVIWLEGDPDEPITKGHVDGYLLPAPANKILVEAVHDEQNAGPPGRERDVERIKSAFSKDRWPVVIKRVLAPRKKYWKYKSQTFAPCYLNAYITAKSVVTACYGDEERDAAARMAIEEAFDRPVKMLCIDNIANEGGGIHCLTQSMPVPDRQRKA